MKKKDSDTIDKLLKFVTDEEGKSLLDLNLKNDAGDTPLLYAIKNEDSDTTDKLLEFVTDTDKEGKSLLDLHFYNKKGDTPLLLAIKKEDSDTIDKLLKFARERDKNDKLLLNLNFKDENNEGYTALLLAIDLGNINIINKLLEFVTDTDKEGKSLLDLNLYNNEGYTPLLLAIKKEDSDTIDKLLKFVTDEEGKSLLDLNLYNNQGDTPLLLAIRKQDVGTIDKLLEFAGKRDNNGKILLDLNIKNNQSDTPLLLARKKEDLDTINKLLEFVTDTDKEGKSLLDLNLQNNQGPTSTQQSHHALPPVGNTTNQYSNIYIQIDDDITTTNTIKALSPKFVIGGSFLRLVHSDTYVDKTNLIMALIDYGYTLTKTQYSVLLITCPRRFGKSINMQMLKHFLSIEFDDNQQQLHTNDTQIYKIITKMKSSENNKFAICNNENFMSNYFKKFPVIFVDCQSITGGTVEDVKNNFRLVLYSVYKEHNYIINFFSQQMQTYDNNPAKKFEAEEELKKFKKYCSDQVLNDGELVIGLKYLVECLYKFHKKKVIILMDEYDTPINRIIVTKHLKNSSTIREIQSFYDDMLCNTFKGNEDLVELGVMTGISGIIRALAESKLNNVKHLRFLNHELQPYYGASKSEVDFVLRNISEDCNSDFAKKLSEYYGGYHYDNTLLYNLWSVIQASEQKVKDKALRHHSSSDRLQSYWSNSGTIEALDSIFDLFSIRDIVHNLIAGSSYKFNLLDKLTIKNVIQLNQLVTASDDIGNIQDDHIRLFFSYIFELGYLTTCKLDDHYMIPNEEIRKEFCDKMISYSFSRYKISNDNIKNVIQQFEKLVGAQCIMNKETIESNTKSMENALNKLFQTMSFADIRNPQHGFNQNEDLFHTILNSLIMRSSKLCKFGTEIPENNTERGRIDILFATTEGIGGIIEVKCTKNNKISGPKGAVNALKQVYDKHYNYIFEHDTYKSLVTIGSLQIGANFVVNDDNVTTNMVCEWTSRTQENYAYNHNNTADFINLTADLMGLSESST